MPLVRKKTFNQLFIEKVVKPENLNWPREQKILKKIKDSYGEDILNNIDIKVNSLAFFLTEDGRNYLQKIENSLKYKLEDKEKIILTKNKIGEDKQINPIISIKDFINKYGRIDNK